MSATHAQSGFPSKPITLVVPYAAGGLTDQLARELGAYMTTTLKQPVIVENRPGGAAQIAMNFLKGLPADGHTVFIGDVPSLATNVGLFPKLSYDPRKDLQAVTELVEAPALVVVPNKSPFKTFDDLVKAAKAKPNSLSYASQGVGTGGHLFGTLLSDHIKAPMTHAAYRGSMPGLADVISAQVDFMYDAMPTAGPLATSQKVRALAVGADKRSPLLPDVPTLKELGYGSIVPTFWWGAAVKRGTPEPVVAKLHEVITAAMHDAGIAKKFTSQGILVKTNSPAEFGQYLNSEVTYWTKIMRDAGMQAE
ncbi:tripartite tricarboxylate transporter substrate binding protein [Diaphorobacter sp. HDW4A]|nr:tripartite tricarboxylate transporter substrate binding protein [Diaphorobacter sp. HDW4A]